MKPEKTSVNREIELTDEQEGNTEETEITHLDVLFAYIAPTSERQNNLMNRWQKLAGLTK